MQPHEIRSQAAQIISAMGCYTHPKYFIDEAAALAFWIETGERPESEGDRQRREVGGKLREMARPNTLVETKIDFGLADPVPESAPSKPPEWFKESYSELVPDSPLVPLDPTSEEQHF